MRRNAITVGCLMRSLIDATSRLSRTAVELGTRKCCPFLSGVVSRRGRRSLICYPNTILISGGTMKIKPKMTAGKVM
jgi:hypothetical protein